MKKLAFLGAGKMATAIACGLVGKKVFSPAEIIAGDVSAEAAAAFSSASGAECSVSIAGAVSQAETVLLAVKPQHLTEAVSALDLKNKSIISIAAGVSIAKLIELTGSTDVVRVMPNTPAMYNCGVAAVSGTASTRPGTMALAKNIFSAVGSCYETDEKLLDAVTGLSGSGPAYVFSFVQAMADGGVAAGLPRAMALEMAVGTVLGSAVMLKESKLHPDILKDMVTSPAGTTARALEVLENGAFTGLVIGAVRAAAERSAELGKPSK